MITKKPPEAIGKAFRSPITSEVYYTEDAVEFMNALDKYKRDNDRPHPDWDEVLRVAHSLGYRKVCDALPFPTFIRGNRKAV